MNDNLIIKRRINISDLLNNSLPNVLAKLISEYDYYLEGNSYTLPDVFHFPDCLAELPGGQLMGIFADYTLKIWDLKTRICNVTWASGYNIAFCFALLPNNRIVCGSIDTTLRIWNVKTGICEDILKGHAYIVTSINVLSDGRIVSGSSDATLKIWNLETKMCELTLIGHTEYVSCVAELHNEQELSLVSGSYDNTLKI
jgi:WD40 repeat protein